MVISYKFFLFALQTIILINIAQSVVLLTANMDDVKKLARKFVSESLADQIADFIYKVSNQRDKDKLSEENEKSQLNQVSGENFLKDIMRQGPMIAWSQSPLQHQVTPKLEPPVKFVPTKTEKNAYFPNEPIGPLKSTFIQEHPNKPIGPHKSTFIQEHPNKPIGPHKSTFIQEHPNKPIGPHKSRFIQEQDYGDKALAQMTTIKTSRRPEKQPKITQLDFDAKISEIMMAATNSLNRYKQYNSQQITDNIKSTRGYAEGDNYFKSDLRGYPKHKMDNSLIHVVEVNQNYTNATNAEPSISRYYPGFNIDRAMLELTSRKARFEFDQYDNFKYPKSQFVATSGPVALPKISSSTWWAVNNSEQKA